MPVVPGNSPNLTGTIGAGGADAKTLDLSGSRYIAFVIKNTGSVAIDSFLFEKAPLGDLFGVDAALATAMGASLAAGATSPIVELPNIAFRKLRITLGCSGAGTTYAIQARGID